MKRALIGISVFVVALLGSGRGLAQHEHGSLARAAAGPEAHHACLDAERAALERGEGFGMALVADQNGYPGPKHILDLKSQLKLTPSQQAAVEELFAEMQRQALQRGKEVLLAESRLNELFAQNRPEAELREAAFRVATLRAELRWVHLSAHLAARRLLTPEQLALYQKLRRADPATRPAQNKPESR